MIFVTFYQNVTKITALLAVGVLPEGCGGALGLSPVRFPGYEWVQVFRALGRG